MIDINTGRYWDFGWQLIDGCTPCSPGCDNCWSAAMTHHVGKGGFTKFCGEFNGVIEVHTDRLNRPMKRKKPAVYAIWNDLFHEDVSFLFQQYIYETMQEIKRHVYLILTKRPEIMAKRVPEIIINLHRSGLSLDNAWHGLTVCNQQEMEEKGEDFFNVPGKKFLSFEPLLSKVILPPWVIERGLLSCVILGGETGPKARPMHPDWVRLVRDQCQAAGVPFFFKQWGEWLPAFDSTRSKRHEFPDGERMFRIGKKAAGRILDGVTHDDLPWVKK